MIGVFDSGLGGLSALSELRRILPSADFTYFGDTARTPYGTRSPDVILGYAEEAFAFLSRKGCRATLSACGTVSAVALPRLMGHTEMPLFGIITPAVDALFPKENENILVLATTATVESHAFAEAILKKEPTARVTEFACPFFVAMVENGLYGDDPLVAACVRRTLAPLAALSPDAVILGCTHFPYLSGDIQAFFPAARVINAARVAAESLAAALPPEERTANGRVEIYVSDSVRRFRNTARPFFKDADTVEVKRADKH